MRPFIHHDQLQDASLNVWNDRDQIGEEQLLEAIASHPRIGDRSASSSNTLAETFSENEQRAVLELESSSRVLQELAELNERYWDKFGFVFLICASGKAPEFMLEQLRTRLENSREDELVHARDEQAKITQLRIDKLLLDLGLVHVGSPRGKRCPTNSLL